MEYVDIGSTSAYLSAHTRDDVVARACEQLAAAGADAVVLCGTVIVGMAARLRDRVRCRVYDGAEAVQMAIAEIQAWQAPGKSLPPVSSTIGLSPALTRLLGGENR